MTRIEIIYSGELFTVAAEDPDIFRAELTDLISDGGCHWLSVNRGEGVLESFSLLVGQGIPIAVGALKPHPGGSIGGTVRPPQIGV